MFSLLRTLTSIALLTLLLSVVNASATALDVSGGVIELYTLENPLPPPTPVAIGAAFDVSSDLFREGGSPSPAVALAIPATLVIAEPDPADFMLCVGAHCSGGLTARRVTREDRDGDGIREVIAWFEPSDFYALVEGDPAVLAAQPLESADLQPYYGLAAGADAEALPAELAAPPASVTFTYRVSGTVYGWPELLELNPPLQMERPGGD